MDSKKTSKKKSSKKKLQPKPKPQPKPKAKTRSVSSPPTDDNGNGSSGQLALLFHGVFMPMGVAYDAGLPYDEWTPDGIRFRRVKEWLQFAIGDWLNHGEAAYGEMYAQAASETGLPEETLMILKYVSSRIEPARRIKDLTWSHHREVAKFPPEEQDKWLERARDKAWSVKELKDALVKAGERKRKDREKEGGEGGDEAPPTGEACECCGSSPAPMRVCGKCLAVAAGGLESEPSRLET